MPEVDIKDVIIVGAGPVGLFLACQLHEFGLSFTVLERSEASVLHSRAVGIHPPSLELFKELGFAEAFLDRGLCVPAGKAFANIKELGTLSFKYCPKPYPFVLTLPQFETEALLSRELEKRSPKALMRGFEVSYIEQDENGVQVAAHDKKEKGATQRERHFRARYLIACDGKESLIREQLGIRFSGEAYPDTYLMGDFKDSTKLLDNAGIYLTDDGLIESFPLPNKIRRWVAKTEHYVTNPKKEDLAELIKQRLEHEVPIETNSMLSSFGVQHFLAKRFVSGRVLLAGDAAHVLSPIGGQGMNLGWLDAKAAACTLKEILQHDADALTNLSGYEKERRKAAKAAIRRAAFNMQLGRKTNYGKLKYAFVKVMLNTPLERVFAHLFTMRWL